MEETILPVNPQTLSVHGHCDHAFAAVKRAFIANFEQGREVGASVSLWVEGKNVVDLWAGMVDRKGTPWQEHTICTIYSVTKSLLAICAQRLVDQGLLNLDAPVVEYWPEFGAAGKEKIPVRWLLTHKSGLAAVRNPLPFKALFDFDTMAKALAEQKPWWTPGTRHGYHLLTFGWLMGEVIRRITGKSVGRYFHDEIAGPLGLDIHIGIPKTELSRCVPSFSKGIPELHTDILKFIWAMVVRPYGVTLRSVINPVSIITERNSAAWRLSEIPGANGQANARSLAHLYGVLANGGVENGIEVLTPQAIERCGIEESNGLDELLRINTRFGPGFILPQARDKELFSRNIGAFGHTGAGGAFAFADPSEKLGFSYVMNRMGSHILVDPRPKAIVDAVYRCL